MSSIEKFYTTTITVKRMTWSNDSAAEISAGSITGHIQQASPEFAKFLGEALGKTFVLWCAKTEDIEAGDTITIASGDYVGTYNVKNIQLNATGNNQHLEVACVKIEV